VIKIAVHGGGRMAREIVNQAHSQGDCEIVAIVSRSGAAWAGEIPVSESWHVVGVLKQELRSSAVRRDCRQAIKML
jgi:dihydrodipicolinate reductase